MSSQSVPTFGMKPETGESNVRWKDLPDFERLSPIDILQLIDSRAWINTTAWLSEEIERANPTEAHRIIADFCEMGYVDYIFSLNYDDLFERVCDRIEVITNTNLLENLLLNYPKIKPYLIKVHGDKSMAICLTCGYISIITLSIRIWIREVNRKDDIVSEFWDSVLKRLKKKDLLNNRTNKTLKNEILKT